MVLTPITNFSSISEVFKSKAIRMLSAVIGFSARILSKNGRLVASRVFLQSRKLDKVDPLSAVAAFNDAFDNIATELITWTTNAI